ncbi:hypothetical protein C1N53_09460 [Pontibacter sp. SGAir0037]|nr:hypothetical protein C1N53_09460 [Pontibacter sp. SGAir0037]
MCSATFVQAQNNKAEKAPAANTKLEKQYESLKSNSNTWQGYKVVNINTLESFWKSVQETVAAKDQKLNNFEAEAEAKLQEARKDVAGQQQQLQTMQNEIKQKEADIQQSMHDITHISVLGIDVPKQLYIILNSGIILALLIALGVIAVQHKSSKSVATEKRKAYDQVAQELNDYMKNARERELKIKRELQTERNLVEELQQQLSTVKKQQV